MTLVTELLLSQISCLVWVEKLFMVAQRGQGEGIISTRNLIPMFLSVLLLLRSSAVAQYYLSASYPA